MKYWPKTKIIVKHFNLGRVYIFDNNCQKYLILVEKNKLQKAPTDNDLVQWGTCQYFWENFAYFFLPNFGETCTHCSEKTCNLTHEIVQ